MDQDFLKHTVSYSRKKNLGNYESEDVGLFIQFHTEVDASLSAILAEARAVQDVLVAEVLDRLGIEYEIDPETGSVSEVRTAPPSKSFVPGPPGPESAFGEITDNSEPKVGPNSTGVGPVPPFAGDTKDKNERGLNTKWAKARLETHPTEFFDNRSKKESGEWKDTSPDYTHKDSRVAIWLS